MDDLKVILNIAAIDEENKTTLTLISKDAKKILDYIEKLENENNYLKNKYLDNEKTQIYKK